MRLTEQYTVAFVGWPELLVLAFVAGAIAFWIWMIVDCANHESPGSTKVCWLLVILLAGFIGAPLYFVVRRLPRSTARSSTTPSFQAPRNSEAEFRTFVAAEAATGASAPTPSILKEAGSREVSAAANSTVRDCRPVQSSGTSKIASASSPTNTGPEPPTDYDLFDDEEHYRLDDAGGTYSYHCQNGWRYVQKGKARVFLKAAEPFIRANAPTQTKMGPEPPTDYDLFDDAVFERLSSAGAPFYYQQSWCYHVDGRARVFVAAAKPFIKGRDRPAGSQSGENHNGGIENRLKALKSLHEQGLITDSEFAMKRSEILKAL